jgi:hypothetical protein
MQTALWISSGCGVSIWLSIRNLKSSLHIISCLLCRVGATFAGTQLHQTDRKSLTCLSLSNKRMVSRDWGGLLMEQNKSAKHFASGKKLLHWGVHFKWDADNSYVCKILDMKTTLKWKIIIWQLYEDLHLTSIHWNHRQSSPLVSWDYPFKQIRVPFLSFTVKRRQKGSVWRAWWCATLARAVSR